MFDEIWLNFLMRSGTQGRLPEAFFMVFQLDSKGTKGARVCQCAPSFRDFPRLRCCGLIASFPGPCASSGGRLPEALFMVFQLDSKGAKACISCRSRQELPTEYLVFTHKIRL